MRITRIFFVMIALLALVSVPGGAAPKPPKTQMDTPVISCGGGPTQTSINLQVCAGASGAPAGFSIQWMTAADFAANGGWYLSEDSRLCKASFSGNANLSRYNLGPNECVTVTVGEFLFDNGASTNCLDALVCGTSYVFHAFAHANSTLNRSNFTANSTCSTLACDHAAGCTLTQGYWSTHNDLVCATNPGSPLCVSWPVTSLTLGTVTYDQAQLLSIFNQPASGNGLIALAHQLIAAKLNVANGADDSSVAGAIVSADALIGGLVVPPVGSGFLAPSATGALITTLTNFNEGAIGPGHCQ
ncbi:MAG TPA: hypothetical protein VGP73_04195 [Thermoanaerobaculia bacterium]